VSGAEKVQGDAIAEIVKKTNGDWAKVSPEDRDKLTKIAGGYSANAYQMKKKELGIK
jgi:hypothetical protein